MEILTVLGLITFSSLALLQPLASEASTASGGRVLGTTSEAAESFLDCPLDPITLSRFAEKTETVVDQLPFKTEYREDPNREWGEEESIQAGQVGQRTKTYHLTFWDGRLVSRELTATQTKPPINEIRTRGTKIIWRTEPVTGYDYWAKLRVWATSYDGNCLGCRGLTYSGTPVRQGVCAVDPKVIPLGTNFYIPGYGICRSEDVGGGIKGREVDLGFEEVKKGFWSARYTDVYLLTNAPK